jgi:hypothetical protein
VSGEGSLGKFFRNPKNQKITAKKINPQNSNQKTAEKLYQ